MDRRGKDGIKERKREKRKGRERVVTKDMTRRGRGRNEANIRGMDGRTEEGIKKKRKRNGEKR